MGLSIQFLSYSHSTWTRSASGSTTDAVLQNLETSPAESLPYGGSTSISVSQNALKLVASGDMDIYCTWIDQTGWRFGVKAIYPVHVFTVGKAPYWQTMHDAPTGTPGTPIFHTQGGDVSAPYNWSWTLATPLTIQGSAPGLEYTVAGYKITAVPTSKHDDLSILVTLSDT